MSIQGVVVEDGNVQEPEEKQVSQFHCLTIGIRALPKGRYLLQIRSVQ